MIGIPTDNLKAIDRLSDILKDVINSGKLIFRGVSDFSSHKLIPKIGREEYTSIKEKILFNTFKKQAFSLLNSSQNTDWDFIALAQHHGLSTRLLDWTDNILVALYFAVINDIQKDGAIYALEIPAYTEHDHWNYLETKNPLENFSEDFFIFRPKMISERILSQQGLFTISSNPKKEIKPKFYMTIESALKDNLRYLLDKIGINERSLFPSLDSLATDINMNYGKYR